MLEYLKGIYEFFTSGLFGFVVDVTAYFIKAALYYKLVWLNAGLQASWSIADTILSTFGLQEILQEFVNSIDSKTAQFIQLLRGFEAMTIVLTARLTKFIFGLIGK